MLSCTLVWLISLYNLEWAQDIWFAWFDVFPPEVAFRVVLFADWQICRLAFCFFWMSNNYILGFYSAAFQWAEGKDIKINIFVLSALSTTQLPCCVSRWLIHIWNENSFSTSIPCNLQNVKQKGTNCVENKVAVLVLRP